MTEAKTPTKLTKTQKQTNREFGRFILGLVIGGLIGVAGGLWSSYFIEWYKTWAPPNPDWTLNFVGSSILFFGASAALLWYARRLIIKNN